MTATNLLRLSEPGIDDEKCVWAFRGDFIGHNVDGEIPGSGGLARTDSYENWLADVSLYTKESTVPPGKVPANILLVYRTTDSTLVGILQIRHRLTEYLARGGGHVGYSVAPSERGQGYATEMLRLALKYCQKLGLERVLVTCDEENVASAHVIMSNGGVLENTVDVNGTKKQRYWIPIH